MAAKQVAVCRNSQFLISNSTVIKCKVVLIVWNMSSPVLVILLVSEEITGQPLVCSIDFCCFIFCEQTNYGDIFVAQWPVCDQVISGQTGMFGLFSSQSIPRDISGHQCQTAGGGLLLSPCRPLDGT